MYDGELSQASINSAFKRPQRRSKRVFDYEDRRIHILGSMKTNRLGVITRPIVVDASAELEIPFTNLERTLIDIVVRPTYAGGPRKILDAYAEARTRVNTEELAGMLRELAYVYPYHQCIGYCMERAGYSSEQVAPLRALPRDFDFYLAHQIDKPCFVPEWRLHVPQELEHGKAKRAMS